MSEVYLLSACRTPIGKFRKALSKQPVTKLGATVVRGAVERSNLPTRTVDEVIMGNVLSAGVGQAPARQATIHAGLPPNVPALTINKMCGSGLKAVMLAARAVQCGDADAVVAGGMESMSRAPWILPREGAPLGQKTVLDSMVHDGLTCAFSKQSMGDIADDLSVQFDVNRARQDEYAVESHRRAVVAQGSGAFDSEIVPVKNDVGAILLTQDEGPRSATDESHLAVLPPVFRRDGTITAGNSSMISDGAAAVLVASEQATKNSGRRPLARIVAMSATGTEPHDLFTAPVDAVRQLLAMADRKLADIDLFEINEAFAVQMLVCMDQLGLSHDRVNVHGGAIALGHPIGASGARVLVSLLHALEQRDLRMGVAALCIGGGNAVAMLVERPM